MMNYKQKLVSTAVIMACSALTSQAQANLAANAILKFDNGAKVSFTIPGTSIVVTTTTGSYFSMDQDGLGVSDSDKTAILLETGLALGTVQPASGSHSGAPDGTESLSVDKAWNYFGNTGMHQVTTAITSASDDGAGTVTLNMAGWSVTWNGIASIPMGGDTANFASDTSLATLTCYSSRTDPVESPTIPNNYTYSGITDCGNASSSTVYFVLDLASHVPLGDASGFGGVAYTTHLEGTVFVPPAMTTSNTSVGAGTYATNASSSDGRISMADLTAQGVPDDSGYTFNGGLYDFTVTTTAGAAAEVMVTLTAPIPANAVYRKYINSAWTTFTADGSNKIASAAKVSGSCPVVGNSAYDHTNGLVEGDECMEITIVNGGAYDADGASDTTVLDPGGVASAVQVQVDTRTSSTSGCSMSETPVNAGERADWWLVAGFLGALGWLRLYRRRSNQV